MKEVERSVSSEYEITTNYLNQKSNVVVWSIKCKCQTKIGWQGAAAEMRASLFNRMPRSLKECLLFFFFNFKETNKNAEQIKVIMFTSNSGKN